MFHLTNDYTKLHIVRYISSQLPELKCVKMRKDGVCVLFKETFLSSRCRKWFQSAQLPYRPNQHFFVYKRQIIWCSGFQSFQAVNMKMPTHQACIKERWTIWLRNKTCLTKQTSQFASLRYVSQLSCSASEPHVINPIAYSWIIQAGADTGIDWIDVSSSAVYRQHQLSSLYSWHFHRSHANSF